MQEQVEFQPFSGEITVFSTIGAGITGYAKMNPDTYSYHMQKFT